MLITRPPPCLTMARSASRLIRNAPRKVTPISRSNSSAVLSSNGFLDQDAGIVDQNVETAEPVRYGREQREHLRLVGHVRAHGKTFAAGGANLGDHGLNLLLRCAVGDGNPRALGSKRQRDRAADAAGAARHQSALAPKRAVHAITSPRSTL